MAICADLPSAVRIHIWDVEYAIIMACTKAAQLPFQPGGNPRDVMTCESANDMTLDALVQNVA